jgi:glycopeptide antibiotics resistance protein
VFHRHPFLSLLTFAYLGFVGWVTLTPLSVAPTGSDLAYRVLARIQRHPDLAWVTYDRLEFWSNVALFVPVGLFLLLLFGTRLWLLAVPTSLALTSAIETAQRSIPGRVPDPSDLLANMTGAMIGIGAGLLVTWPAAGRGRVATGEMVVRTARRQPSRP